MSAPEQPEEEQPQTFAVGTCAIIISGMIGTLSFFAPREVIAAALQYAIDNQEHWQLHPRFAAKHHQAPPGRM